MKAENKNLLYPVFFKMDSIKLLIVGGGEVAKEKLDFLLKSSPNARVTVLASRICEEITDIFNTTDFQINIIHKSFSPDVLDQFDMIIAATGNRSVNKDIYRAAKEKGRLINVADTPDLCDFYMGSIVTKGNLKIGISTNGKSPTFAKRFRQLLEEVIPDHVEELIPNLHIIRNRLQGNFARKVEYLNTITKALVEEDSQ